MTPAPSLHPRDQRAPWSPERKRAGWHTQDPGCRGQSRASGIGHERTASKVLRLNTPAFTLLETVLATVIGAMVVIACMGMFAAVARTETALANRANEVTELAMTQRTLRRALLTMVMMPAADRPDPDLPQQLDQQPDDGEAPEPMPVPRFIIEADPSPALEPMLVAAASDGFPLPPVSGTDIPRPQRLEMVLASPPVPQGLSEAGALAQTGWALVSQADAQLDATAGVAEANERTDPGYRSVFELRPDGYRERIIAGLGITGAASIPANFGRGDDGRLELPRRLRQPARGWTLWWRPVYEEERAARDAGLPFDADNRPELLAEAVPLVRTLVECRFSAFALDRDAGAGNRFTQFSAWASEDLPGYVEVEARTANGRYANWMFEVGWQVSDEGVNDSDDTGTGDDAENETDNALNELEDLAAGGGGARRGGGGGDNARRPSRADPTTAPLGGGRNGGGERP